ncbi:putative immunity protein [Staphylococcus pseudoxylosus]|uniref:putative immunity protein n=1 Tax=Staphylococcus pseudoxylosus TaxID=2282419 RepID=UPI002DBCEA50|nr:hypothetical protein [Staphylococcus pseudoxylosus]MEB7753249.1 hypothetical protein [Staphylococcus pseudoxylosus]
MNFDDYAWNEHEKMLKREIKIKIPSQYKVKIKDESAKRLELEQILEGFTQKKLAEWSITNAKRFIEYIDIEDTNLQNSIISRAEETLYKRIQDLVSAYELRQIGFLANQLSKQSNSEISKFASRVFAQAIATGHMRGHAIVSSDYAIKVINLKYDNHKDSIVKERDEQINLANRLKN